MKPITKKFVADWEKSRNATKKLEKQIIDRITYICEQIYHEIAIEKPFSTWYFFGAGDGGGDVGPIDISGDDVSITMEPYSEMVCIIGDNEWDLGEGFPTRWLFEGFEQELKDSRAAYLAVQTKKKTQFKQTKASILKKLTSAERKILGV